MVAEWDALLARDSVAAGIYITWRRVADQTVRDGAAVDAGSPAAIEAALVQVIDQLTRDVGPDWNEWRYGRIHRQAFPHPVLPEFDLPTVERRGGNGTVGADGASFREIIDVSDWDRSLTINVPGQSGQPESPFYGNLLPLWEQDEYFPMTFSRGAVEEHAAHRLVLQP